MEGSPPYCYIHTSWTQVGTGSHYLYITHWSRRRAATSCPSRFPESRQTINRLFSTQAPAALPCSPTPFSSHVMA